MKPEQAGAALAAAVAAALAVVLIGAADFSRRELS
jgi:hypothetical protein